MKFYRYFPSLPITLYILYFTTSLKNYLCYFFYLYLINMLCHKSLFLHLKLNLLNHYSRKAFCTIRTYQITLTLARKTGPTRLLGSGHVTSSKVYWSRDCRGTIRTYCSKTRLIICLSNKVKILKLP